MPTYGQRDLAFARGKGCYLYTTSGKKYLDFAGGIAVNSLGHCPVSYTHLTLPTNREV